MITPVVFLLDAKW